MTHYLESPNPEPFITLIAADDHGVVCRGLTALLSSAPDIKMLATTASGREAVELSAVLLPNVVLMDIVMPDMDGIEATKCIKKLSPRTHIVILTSLETEQTVVEATQAGALSYLLKDTDPDELVAAIRAAGRGESTLSPRIATLLMGAMSRRRSDRALHDALSDREMQVLLLLAQGLANLLIAEKLGIGEKTVKSHVSNILSKLYLTDRTQATAYAWRHRLLT
ncbi:response regulator transcription factor [Methylosoma difficile]